MAPFFYLEYLPEQSYWASQALMADEASVFHDMTTDKSKSKEMLK